MALLGWHEPTEEPNLDDLTLIILNVECRDGAQYTMLVESNGGYMWFEELPDQEMTPMQESRCFRIVRSDEPRSPHS